MGFGKESVERGLEGVSMERFSGPIHPILATSSEASTSGFHGYAKSDL